MLISERIVKPINKQRLQNRTYGYMVLIPVSDIGFLSEIRRIPTITEYIDKGFEGKEGSNTMVHSKSKNKKFSVGFVHDDIESSYIICRHRGVDFKFNAKGIPIP
jgi:hypothetical protein